MMEDLNVTYQDLANGQAIQLVGLASSCVVFIPLTKKYGRRSTYIISTALVAATSWWTAYLETKVELYVTSLLYGLAASTTDTSVEMSVSSVLFPADRLLPLHVSDKVSLDHKRRSMNCFLFISELQLMEFMPLLSWPAAS